MAHFIDRRLNGKNKSTVNRQRFLRRHKQQIKESIADAVNKRSITDVDSGEDISIPSRDISEPSFHQGRGGQRDVVHPGNDQFIPGDRIDRPQEALGKVAQAKGKPVQMVKDKTNLYSRSPKTNILICFLKISNYQI